MLPRLGSASISTKLAIAFGTALVLFVAAGAFGLLQLNAVSRATREIQEVWLPRIETLGEIKQAASTHRLLATRRTQTTNFHHLADIAKSTRETLRGLKAAEQAFLDTPKTKVEEQLFAEFQSLWDDYQDTVRGVFRRLEAGEISAALAEFNQISLTAYKEASERLDQLIDYSKQKSNAAKMRARQVHTNAWRLTIGAFFLAALCVVAATMWVARRVSMPILRISEAMERLTAGDSEVRVVQDSHRTDEIGVLAAATAGYRESLLRSRGLAEVAERDRQRLHSAISNMPIGLCMFDAAQTLIVCNRRYAEIYSLPETLTKPGTALRDILHARIEAGIYPGNDPEKYMEERLELVAGGRSVQELIEFNDGRVFSLIHQPMASGGWVATHEDVTERRRAESRIHHMARHDALTDLPNRVLFKERVDEALKRVARGENAAVLCLDLDRFKAVNDTLGHPIGDELLVRVAERLREIVRNVDTVARFGGDEFAIVQTGVEQPKGATALARRVIEALGKSFTIDTHEVVIGASVGIALSPMDGTHADELLKNGDMALYRAKADGRATYRFFEPEMDARMQARRTLELDMRRALAQDEFDVYYQPVVCLKTNKVISLEALLRWHHPERGLVSPGEFIPLAEEIGLIIPLGEWVLRRACQDCAGWPSNVKVSVNLSPVQFQNNRLLESVITALAVSKLPAHRLELEITEGVLLVDHQSTIRILHQLRALGVSIAMDDFGTGYSSLSYLRSFPFDRIKIDGSFVQSIDEQDSSLAIVRAVTGLSESLGMSTTAEGIETKAQLERIRAEGCTEVQGFLFSAPKPASEVHALMAKLDKKAVAAA